MMTTTIRPNKADLSKNLETETNNNTNDHSTPNKMRTTIATVTTITATASNITTIDTIVM